METTKDDHQPLNKNIFLCSQHFSPNRISQNTFIQEGPLQKQGIGFRLGKPGRLSRQINHVSTRGITCVQCGAKLGNQVPSS